MYKLCENCGFMYPDNGKGCPNCNKDNTINDYDSIDSNSINQPTNTIDFSDFNSSQYSQISEDDAISPVEEIKNNVNEKMLPLIQEKILPILKKHKKIIIGIASALLALILISTIINAVINNSPLKISASSFISEEVITPEEIENYYAENENYAHDYYGDYSYSNYPFGAGLIVYGYNEIGYLEESELYNIFDWNGLIEDVNEKLSKKRINNGWTLTFYDIFSSNEYIQINLSDESSQKNGTLKNGDVIEVEYTFSPYYYDDYINLETCTGTVSFTIDGLEDVNMFDPFNYVNFTQSGANSDGKAKLYIPEDLNDSLPNLADFKVVYYDEDTIAIEKDDYIIGKINFYFDNYNDEYHNSFSNGDEVTMYCSSNDDLTANYGIHIANNSKIYTFDSLGEYITKSSTLSQIDINSFKAYSDNYLNERYENYDSYSNIQLNSVYVVDPKDLTNSNSFKNNLVLVYSYTYTGWSSDNETKYMYVSFENLIVDESGAITQTPEEYYDYYNTGYDTVDDLLNRCYGTEYNIVKIQ